MTDETNPHPMSHRAVDTTQGSMSEHDRDSEAGDQMIGESCSQGCKLHWPLRFASMAIIGSLVVVYALLQFTPAIAGYIPNELLSLVGLESPVHQCSKLSEPAVVRSMASADMPIEKFTGKTTCATCAFGVAPLLSPRSLGLALVLDDGRIAVVENAHVTYPEIYRDRESQLMAQVSGRVIKSDERTLWIEPDSLTLVSSEQ